MKGGMEMKNEGTHTWDSDGNVLAFMDAGETYSLTCVEAATPDKGAVIEARGSKGTVKFMLEDSFDDHDLGRIRCRVVGMNAVLRSPSLEFIFLTLNRESAKELSSGDSIKVPSVTKGFEWIREHYDCCLGNGRGVIRLAGIVELGGGPGVWVDAGGKIASEPDWVRVCLAYKLFYGFMNHARRNPCGRGYDEFSLLKLVLDAYGRILTPESAFTCKYPMAEDFFFGLNDDCEAIRDLAKSINRHIRSGDFTPNPKKVERYDTNISQDWLEQLNVWAKKYDFVAAMVECVEQINHSRQNGFRESVDVVRSYSPLRYPNTRVVIEPL